MRIELSVPSKTFLFGEYAVLEGAPGVLLAHGPRFRLIVDTDRKGECLGISPQSPGGQWLRKKSDMFTTAGICFVDCYGGKGGFGASAAQFVLVHAWSHLSQRNLKDLGRPIDLQAMWQDFRDLKHEGANTPSGADIIAQSLGGVVLFSTMPWRAQSVSWPFPDLDFLCVPTGVKVATHEHLRSRLPKSERLLEIAAEATQSVEQQDPCAFVRHLVAYGEELENLNLVTIETRGLIAQVAAIPQVLAIKGCGALGADVLLLIMKSSDVVQVRNSLAQKGLQAIASRENLSAGFKIEVGHNLDMGAAWV